MRLRNGNTIPTAKDGYPKNDEIAMLRESEARWIARIAVMRHTTGDNGKMMLSDFSKWFNARWDELLAAEATAKALASENEGLRMELGQCLLDENNHTQAVQAAADFNLKVNLAIAESANAALRERVERLEKALKDATAHLAAATSSYERYCRKGVTGDALYTTKLSDYQKATARARTALESPDA